MKGNGNRFDEVVRYGLSFVLRLALVLGGLGLVPVGFGEPSDSGRSVVPACGIATNEWENPEVNSIGRLPARTYSMPLADERAALTDALEPETPYVKSLNGNWKFSWAGNPALRVKDFWKTDFDDSDWHVIDVPSCVEMRGFGSPGYTNVRYPHADKSLPSGKDFARILDRGTGKPDYNPVSSYRTTFAVPENWKGREIILRFDGVYSAYYVWVNGKMVGYAEDSKLPSEFDVTSYLADGENLLAVEVYRWCDGSYLEDQDMFRFSGIFRDVTLWARPKDGIWDFSVRTTPVDGYERWKVEVKVEGEQRTEVSLYDADKKKVCDLDSTPAPNVYASTLAARAWSAEKPCLYTLVIRRGADIRMKRVGFKEQKIVGNRFLVNGRPVKFKGVNRHETDPEDGRKVSRESMVADIELMKRFNVNAVRTCHYPDHRLWYDLCDRYGLYVIAEANVEGHEPGYGENGLGRQPEWARSIVERNVRHATFYRNNPCVTMWSMGNETGHGDCFRKAIAEVRKIDLSRPIHWERGNLDADVDSRMYPSVEWLEARGKAGDGQGEVPRTEWEWEEQTGSGNRQSRGKCAFLCEYAHAMGNALGNFQEYWDVFYRYDSLCGGCVWDWVDQAVWKGTGVIDPLTGKTERFLAYGGDFDEEPNDGPFCCNGIVTPDRRVTAKLREVGQVHRNLVVRREGTGFTLENRHLFTNADAFEGSWELLADGAVTRRGTLAVPSVAPLAKGSLPLPREALGEDLPGERVLNVSFALKEATEWAPRGWVVARDQITLEPRPCAVTVASSGGTVIEMDAEVVLRSARTEAVFSRATGTLSALKVGGKVVLRDCGEGVVSGPRLTCFRAFVDNDCWLSKEFFASGLSQLRYHPLPITVSNGVVICRVEVTGSKSAGFMHEAVWTAGDEGDLTVVNRVVPHGVMPSALPRLGLSLRLLPDFGQVVYYGRGPHENYIDRRTSAFLGVWQDAVSNLGEPYVRPQDNGYRSDVRWVELRDGTGVGVRFSASEPLFVQALRCTAEDLAFARHCNGQVRRRTSVPVRDEIFLNLDVRQLGLGGASCGPKPMEGYIFQVEETEWTLKIQAAGREQN